ncbi:MAG: hypothetical protein NTV22_05110 [bacterium]|nr:hypothetical protein [bacterium]
MKQEHYLIAALIGAACSMPPLFAASPLPALDLAICKYLGTTRQEEIMCNRIVAYAGAHIGGVHVDTSQNPPRYYLFDAANNRILGYLGWQPAILPNGPYAPADIVIGQPAMWDSGTANGNNIQFLPPTAATLALLPFPYVSSTAEAPRAGMMATDANGNFYVVDLCNNRVLKYNDPFTTDQIADDVWGTTTFTNRSPTNGTTPPTTSATTLRTQWNYGSTIGAFAAGVEVDAESNMWVADSFNNRVLRYPAGSKTANVVLGQTSFTASGAGTTLDKMYHPTGVRVHPQTKEVFVLDGQDDGPPGPRMLVFRPPFPKGMSASREFGTNILSWARGFCFDRFDSNIVWVADGNHNRIVQFNHVTGQALDCIGQPNLTTFIGIGKYVRPDGSEAIFKQPDGDISMDDQTNLYFTSFYGLNKVMRIPLPITRNGAGHVWSNSEMMKEGMNENSGRTFQDDYGMARWNDQLFVRDRNRVLIWTNYHTAVTFQSADLVLGQNSVNDNNSGGTFEGRPVGVISCSSNLLFACADWKIFIFALPITTSSFTYPATKVISGGNVNQMKWADDNTDVLTVHFNGACYDPVSNVLWVAQNHTGDSNPGARVLRIRNVFAANPVIDLVLGQTNKTGGLKNKGAYIAPSGPFTVNGTDMANPSQVFLDNDRNLYVVDSGYEGRVDNAGNRRVVRFDVAKTNPTNTLFPNYSADGVFCKPNLTTDRNYADANRPGTPITVSFGPSNEMVLTDDTYDGSTAQGMRVFYYPTPHIGAAPQPTHIINTYVGQPAYTFFSGDMIVLQDHTWNRIIFHVPRPTAPLVDVTNNISTVVGATTAIGGTNVNLVGTMQWLNERGGSGVFPAETPWQVTDIALQFGGNLITVSGTNAQGVVGSDSVTITRALPEGLCAPLAALMLLAVTRTKK